MLVFPDKTWLRAWVELIPEKDTGLEEYLPHIDEEWFQEMISCLEIVQLNPRCRDDLACAGATLFYKIIKNHHRVDGNKRSALLVIALLFLLNESYLRILPKDMYQLAAQAASETRSQDVVQDWLMTFFQTYLAALPPKA